MGRRRRSARTLVTTIRRIIMKSRKNMLTVATLLVAGVTSFGIGVAAHAAPAPDSPSWVKHDGKIDYSKLPACIVVLDKKGQPAVDGKGKQVCVPSAEMFAAPPAPGTDHPHKAKVLREGQDKDGIRWTEAAPQTWTSQ